MEDIRIVLQTKRLAIHTASREEMRRFIDAQTDGILAKAYDEMLRSCLAHPEEWEWYAIWMIELPDGVHVGELSFKGRGADGSVEIGYGISEACRGRGYASEAVDAAARWALRQPGIARVEAETETDNAASRRVLEKCGFLPSGITGKEGPRFVRYAVNIRRARADEMDEIMSLVCGAFEEQGIPRELNFIPAERSPIWWCAVENGAVVGTIASYTEDGKTHLGRFVIRPDRRGSGIGTRLLRFAIEDVFAHGVGKIYTESRPVTVKILERMGAKVSGETFPFFDGVCTPIDICREDYLPQSEKHD